MRTVNTAVDSWSGFKVQKIVKITVGDVNFTSSCKNALKLSLVGMIFSAKDSAK